MATYFSSAFTGLNATTATNVNGTSALVNAAGSSKVQSVQAAHARTRTSIAHISFNSTTSNFTTADVAHLFIVKPTDRIVALEFASDDTGTSGSIDVGLYEVVTRDGAMQFTVSDSDLFATAIVCNTSATAWTHIMHESTTVGIEYVGKPAWMIAGLGNGNYTDNATMNFAISVTPTANTTADFDMIFRLTYIAGD